MSPRRRERRSVRGGLKAQAEQHSRPQRSSRHCWWKIMLPGLAGRSVFPRSRHQGLRGVHPGTGAHSGARRTSPRVQQHRGRAAGRGQPDDPAEIIGVAAGPLARRRRPRPDLVDVLERRGELVEAGRRTLERLPGRARRFGRVTDPWVSYDKAGNLYFIGQPIDSAALGISAISVTSWNGTSLAAPQILIEDYGDRVISNDKVSITGDPTRAGYAYATWLPSRTLRGTVRWPTSTRCVPGRADDLAHDRRRRHLVDAGADAPLEHYFQGNQIAVGPDGTLYNVTANLFTGAVRATVYMGVMRSRDAGRTGRLRGVARSAPHRLFVPDDLPDPGRGLPARHRRRPDNGDIYVVWSTGSARRSTRSSWPSPPTAAPLGAARPSSRRAVRFVQSYSHSIEVTEDGTVVLTYWDDRNNVLGDGVAPRTCGCATRTTAPGSPSSTSTGPSITTAPISFFAPGVPRGLFLGDYMGLETIAGDDVISFFSDLGRRGRPFDPEPTTPDRWLSRGGAAASRRSGRAPSAWTPHNIGCTRRIGACGCTARPRGRGSRPARQPNGE